MDLAAAAAVLMHSKPDISKVSIRSALLSFTPNARTTQTIGISGVQSLYVILVFRCSRDLLTKYILIRFDWTCNQSDCTLSQRDSGCAWARPTLPCFNRCQGCSHLYDLYQLISEHCSYSIMYLPQCTSAGLHTLLSTHTHMRLARACNDLFVLRKRHRNTAQHTITPHARPAAHWERG